MREEFLILFMEVLLLVALLYFFYWKRLKIWMEKLDLKNMIFILVIFITFIVLWWTRFAIYPVQKHEGGPVIYLLDRLTGSLELIYQNGGYSVRTSNLDSSKIIIPLILIGIIIFMITTFVISKFRKKA